MGLALFHYVPRDDLLQYALLLLLVVFALQAAVIGQRNRFGGAGTIYVTTVTVTGGVAGPEESTGVVSLNALSAIYSVDSRKKVCDPSAATLTRDCARFAEAMHAVIGLHLASFITNVFAMAMAAFAVVRLSPTTTLIILRFWAATLPATVLAIAALGLYFSQCVRHAKQVAKQELLNSIPSSSTTTTMVVRAHFHRGPLANLLIALTVLMMVALILSSTRLVMLCFLRKYQKARSIKEKNIAEVMSLRLVNDDWKRQQEVLRNHARSVRLEIQVKDGAQTNPSGDAGEATSDPVAAAAEPCHSPFAEERSSASQPPDEELSYSPQGRSGSPNVATTGIVVSTSQVVEDESRQ